MEIPPPDANKLLQSWMEWERGEVTPGRVMANLKTGGLPVLLESLAGATVVPGAPAPAPAPATAAKAGGQKAKASTAERTAAAGG